MNAGKRFSLGLLGRVAVVALLLAANTMTLASRADAAWATANGGAFQVGGKLAEIVPTSAGTTFVDPTCGSQGGTSLALVRGSKLVGLADPVPFPVVLVVSCLDNGGSPTVRGRLSFINPINVTGSNGTVVPGTVVQQMTTTLAGATFAPGNGWSHLVHRPDKGDLLGCGSDGILYSIDYRSSATTAAVTKLNTPVLASCGGLAWDAETDTIYQGVAGATGNKIGSVARFKEGAASPDATFVTSLACPANGLAISGGVVLVSCTGLLNNTLAIQRIDKNSGANLGQYSSIALPVPGSTTSGFSGLTPLNSDPGLGDLACDPVTFQKPIPPEPASPSDRYRDAVWSRRGANGNGVAAVEFPAFTCGLPSNSVVMVNNVPFSPLAAGLSTGSPSLPGSSPLASCFDSNGIVKDTDGDGLPDCWEKNLGGSTASGPDSGGVDFDGDGVKDVTLCAQVNANGDGTTLATECANENHKDLFVQIGWMDNHKPDPLALSQSNVATVGVKSVREAFNAAPVSNPDSTTGIKLHMQVDKQPVTFKNFTGSTLTSHVTSVALTPCTAPANLALSPDDAADYDAIKATNFGVYDIGSPPSANAVNAMRLAWRYVLFAHNLVGNPSGGSNSSGCSEVGGDDAVVSLGSFVATTVNGITHNRGTTDQQAGTFMHEFGHLLGFQHGGEDTINNKPNYRSVMSYSRQFAGSPIANRRLDYSRSDVDLTETTLNECLGVTATPDPSLAPITPYFPANDQIAFGPGAWSVVTPLAASVSSPCVAGQFPINWDRLTSQGKTFQTATKGDLNGDGSVSTATLFGFNDWANVLYRFSAAIDFAGGRSEVPFTPGTTKELTKEDEIDFFERKDIDTNGIGDARDCGGVVTFNSDPAVPPSNTFPCKHRIDIKPSFGLPKTIKLGTEATVSIAIFSEKSGTAVWDATKQLVTLTNGCTASTAPCLTFSIEDVIEPVKTNKNGQGTCSAQDVSDPITGIKDGVKDMVCQFATSGLPIGTHFGVVSGYFTDPLDNNAVKAFSARQEVTILP
jgi:hypothetical protein